MKPRRSVPRRTASSAVGTTGVFLSFPEVCSDYWPVADLTPADVREMEQFLLDTCDDVRRWLPAPQWEPTWQSEAARECANTERGPGGPWGETAVRTVYAGGALYLDTILRCVRAMTDALTAETTSYVVNTLARAAMEAGAQLWWLLEPEIGVRRRVGRFWLIRASGARYLDDMVRKIDPAAPPGVYGETPDMVKAAVADLGISYRERQFRNGKWSWSCEGDTLPGYTARATAFEAAVNMSAAYAIYSAAAHAEWHAVIAGFREEALPGGGTILLSRPDLVAVGGAVLASAGFVIVPADRALRLLGRTARLAEFGYHARRAEDLIRRLGLPEEWSRWRR